MKNSRFIGIQHRVKVSAAGEERPTLAVIRDENGVQKITFDDDQAEFDFVVGKLPTAWRDVTHEDKVADFPLHHIKWKPIDPDKETPLHQVQKIDGKQKQMHKVPAAYEGLREGDVVGMVLGGSGDYLALGLATRGKDIGASVYRMPPATLKHYRARQFFSEHYPEESQTFETLLYKKERDESETAQFTEVKTKFNAFHAKHKSVQDTAHDAELLAELVEKKRGRFYRVENRDERVIVVRERYRARMEAMKARIACEQRLRENARGEIFREAGLANESSIAAAFDRIKANDAVYKSLELVEKEANKSLERALKEVPFYEHIQSLESYAVGLGPAIMARIISGVIEIRRFDSASKLIAFAGAHVLPDGRFPRRRGGEIANWHGDIRQALYLLGDQWVKRPGSHWGAMLIENKQKLRTKHPEPIIDPDTKKRKYSDGHIHKMAIWRTITQFVRWLYGEWSTFEKNGNTASGSQQKVA